MSLSRRTLLALAAAGAGVPSWPGFAEAETYPSRPVHLIADLPPGLAPDVLARLVAPQLAARLGQD
ncbi:MAG: tripartite tricarboxylate transporter substrate binding protein, partial [Xanthobacteraceae bacterium]